MKKVVLLVSVAFLSFQSCKKEEGCTDKTATNYNAEAEEDDGSCKYASTTDTTTTGGNTGGTTDTTGTGGTNGGNTGGTTDTGGNNGGTTDTTTTGGNNGGTTGGATAGTLMVEATKWELGTATTAKAGNYTHINVPKKDSILNAITIQIDGGIPSTKTEFGTSAIFAAGKVVLSVSSGGVNWQPKFQGTDGGTVTIEPAANGAYNVTFTGVKLVDNAFAPTMTKSFSANFSVKEYKAEFKLEKASKTYTASVVGCTKSATAITLTASAVNEDNKSGSLSIYVPVDVASSNYTVSKGGALDWLSPGAGKAYVNALTYTTSGATAQIYNSAQSGTVEVVKSGNELSFKFANLPTTDGGSNIDVVSGTASCLLK